MQAIIWLANWEAEAWYDTGCVKKEKKQKWKEKEKIMNKRFQIPRIMAKSYKILVFAKPHNTEQPLVSGMPWLAVLCPLLAGNAISEIQGYICNKYNLC